MENIAIKTPPKTPLQLSEKNATTHFVDSQTAPPPPPPPHNEKSPNSVNNDSNSIITGITPDRLRVPKAFKYPERYTSPTDLMMSPVSKGLLARTRKPGVLLPPSIINQSKIQDLTVQKVGLSQT